MKSFLTEQCLSSPFCPESTSSVWATAPASLQTFGSRWDLQLFHFIFMGRRMVSKNKANQSLLIKFYIRISPTDFELWGWSLSKILCREMTKKNKSTSTDSCCSYHCIFGYRLLFIWKMATSQSNVCRKLLNMEKLK